MASKYSTERNLLKETTSIIKDNGAKVREVQWVGSRDGGYAISWEEFKAIANVTYDPGFGGQIIVTDLIVVGTDWWLERGEYDGSEWWNFHRKPCKQAETKPFTKVMSDRVRMVAGMEFRDSWLTIAQAESPHGKYGPDPEPEPEEISDENEEWWEKLIK